MKRLHDVRKSFNGIVKVISYAPCKMSLKRNVLDLILCLRKRFVDCNFSMNTCFNLLLVMLLRILLGHIFRKFYSICVQ